MFYDSQSDQTFVVVDFLTIDNNFDFEHESLDGKWHFNAWCTILQMEPEARDFTSLTAQWNP